MIYQRKLRQADQQKGHVRKQLKATQIEVTKYKDEIAKITIEKKNNIRESFKTKESQI